MKRLFVLIIGGLLFATGGCGGDGGTSQEANGPSGGANGGKAWDPALGTATVTGVVNFTGKPPRRRPIDMGGKVECSELHAEPVLDESIIINEDGSLKNVFVWVKRGLKGWDFPAPNESVVVNQKGCAFTPHLQGVQVGQEVVIRNSDPFGHNVHSFSKLNFAFNFGQPTQGQEDSRVFDRKEFVRLKCDIHGWMSSHLAVVPHPFFSVTGDDGTFDLPKLPPGEYSIEAWHEEFGRQTQEVTLGDGESKVIDFTFDG